MDNLQLSQSSDNSQNGSNKYKGVVMRKYNENTRDERVSIKSVNQ